MYYIPKTDQQIAEANLFPEGVYAFEILERITLGGSVVQTIDTVSKRSGNEMIILVVNIVNDYGLNKIIIDYLLASNELKLKNAILGCGLEYDNSQQIFASDFIGKTGQVRVGIEKDKTGQYPDKNKVINFIIPGKFQAAQVKKTDLHPFDPANED